MILKYQLWVLKRAIKRMKKEKIDLERHMARLDSRIQKYKHIVNEAEKRLIK